MCQLILLSVHHRNPKKVDVAISNRSSPSNSDIKKIEVYINEKLHQAALHHLKKPITTEVTEVSTITKQWINMSL